jgi:hypothetical protein
MSHVPQGNFLPAASYSWQEWSMPVSPVGVHKHSMRRPQSPKTVPEIDHARKLIDGENRQTVTAFLKSDERRFTWRLPNCDHMEMADLFRNPALVALLGVVVGVLLTPILTLLNAWVMRKRDFNLKVWERFIDRRITAHETVVGLALKMRFICPLGTVQGCEVVRAPQVMMSKEIFDGWLAEFSQGSGPATTWLSTPAKRELNFVQDYLVTVQTNLSAASSEQFPAIGALIRQDFIDLSSSLEKAAFEFFKAEARELRLNDLAKNHKYPLEETTSRLQKTVLLGRWKEVNAMIQSGQVPT